MLKITKESLTLNDPRSVSLDEYITERHEMFLRILKLARKNKQISQGFYEHFMMKVFEPRDWEEAFDMLDEFGNELVHAIQNSEYYILLERLEKGEEMIAKETDPSKKQQYQKLFDSLKQQFERLEVPA